MCQAQLLGESQIGGISGEKVMIKGFERFSPHCEDPGQPSRAGIALVDPNGLARLRQTKSSNEARETCPYDGDFFSGLGRSSQNPLRQKMTCCM
jgi:hypothetical protein